MAAGKVLLCECVSLFCVLFTLITQWKFSVLTLSTVALDSHWTLLMYNSLEKQVSHYYQTYRSLHYS